MKQVALIGLDSGPEVDQKLKHANHGSLGIILGIDFVNSPANFLTPESLFVLDHLSCSRGGGIEDRINL